MMKYFMLGILFLLASNLYAADITTCQTIDSAGTYVLQNNVSSEGTCFTIAAPNVIIDLNGHTVTYDNLTPIAVTNHSFEDSLTGTWDVTNASNATRELGMFVGTTVSKYDGDYALRFALPFTGAQYVRSQQVTLAANTTYSISAMFRNSGNNDAANPYSGGVRDSLTMKIELEGTASSATQTGVTWRGFQFTNFTYTTGASPENHVIRITVDNVNAAATGYAYVDDIKILKTASYGVQVGAQPTTWGNGAVVTNGTITQGQGNGFESHAIYVAAQNYTDGGFNINSLTLTTQGVNSKIIAGLFAYNSLIHHNTINHNVTTIKSRDGYDGAAIYFPYDTNNYNNAIYSNTFNTGIQTAIFVAHLDGAALNHIYSNNITLQTKYTNDFAIAAGGAEVYSNIINCGSGSNSCRGIAVGGTGTKVYDNTVSTQELVRNQEYNGCEAGGTYAMQGEYTLTNAEIYGNTVTATTGAGVCEAAALRLNPNIGSNPSVNIHDNTFSAINTGTAPAYAMKFANIYGSGIQINSNTFATNGRWVYLDYDQNSTSLMTATLTGNKFETTGTLPSPFYPFLVAGGVHANFTFVDNLYGTGDQERFESEVFRNVYGTVDSGSTIIVTTSGDDTTPPITTATPPSGTYGSAQSVSLSCTDNIACAGTYYCTGAACTPTTSYTVPINISTNTTLRYYSVDAVPNTETVKESVYIINTGGGDTTPPVISTTVPTGRYTSTQTVTLTANETATIKYCTSKTGVCTPATTYSAPFKVLQNIALHYYCFNGTDTALNTSTTECKTVTKQRARN